MGDVNLPLASGSAPGAIAAGCSGDQHPWPHTTVMLPTRLCAGAGDTPWWVASSRVAQGSLAHGVPLAEAGAEQTLRTNILGPTSIQVLWTSARDARGYRLEWKRATGRLGAPGPLHRRPVLAAGGDPSLPTGPEPPRTVSLPSSANTYQLMGLQPGTEYRITLYTLYDGGEVATPVTTFQTGEWPPRVPWLVPHPPKPLRWRDIPHGIAQPRDPLGREPPSSLVTAQGKDGGRAVRALQLWPCFTVSTRRRGGTCGHRVGPAAR